MTFREECHSGSKKKKKENFPLTKPVCEQKKQIPISEATEKHSLYRKYSLKTIISLLGY